MFARAQALRQDVLKAFRAKIDAMVKHFESQSLLQFTGARHVETYYLCMWL